MTSIYKSGTITLDNNSNIVTGTGTLFQSVANALTGDLFTLDGSTFYEVYQVDTETQLRIRNVVTGVKYQGASVQDVNFAIIRNFTAGSNAQIASDVVVLQQRWHEREREMSEWFASDFNYHQITNIQGDKVLVITPTGLNGLVDGPVNIEDFGLTSAKESQALDLNLFPVGIFYSRPIYIAGQPSSFGSGIKLVMTNKSDDLFYQKVIELDTAQIRYRIATSAENAETWNTVGGESGGLTEVTWNDIQDIPQTALRWPSFSEITGDISELLPVTATRWPSYSELSGDINEVLPTTATRWPKFSEVTETVSESQLPSTLTANKRSLATSPPVKIEPSLSHRLIDYPKLKKTVDIPTHSPNNRREMLFDDVRQAAYIALTEEWLKIPNVIASREFLLTTDGNRIRFNSSYTGDITLKVYPMGNGGSGLPDSPTLANFEWHTVTTSVSGLTSFGSSFIGLIDYIETSAGFETLSTARSHFNSIDAYYGKVDGSVANNEFISFSLRQDGFWYSTDVMPETPYSIGSSWTQDENDKRLFQVSEADGSTDALRLFNDDWDDYVFEIVIVTDVPNPMALTIGNNADYTTYFEGTYRFIVEQDRFYFKRQASFAPITGSVRVESLRLRVNHYE